MGFPRFDSRFSKIPNVVTQSVRIPPHPLHEIEITNQGSWHPLCLYPAPSEPRIQLPRDQETWTWSAGGPLVYYTDMVPVGTPVCFSFPAIHTRRAGKPGD